MENLLKFEVIIKESGLCNNVQEIIKGNYKTYMLYLYLVDCI